jgi:hypothetical protein
MTKKIHSNLLLLLVIIISFSCSKDEDIKKLSPSEITNILLVSEQLPLQNLSNAIEWPEDVILGVDLGLIELNENGIDKLTDIYEDYSEDGKDDFIKDSNEKKGSEFIKSDWIKSESKNITNSKLNDIKEREFNNNEIIQNKLDNYIPFYINKQTEEISRYQFSFFSKGFWGNLGQISWMHIKSVTNKIAKRDIHYLNPNFINDLQLEWQNKFNIYFSPNTAKLELQKVLSNYQNLMQIKYNYLSKLNNKKLEQNSIPSLNFKNLNNNSVIDIKPIVSQFNLIMLDNLGQLFFELIAALLIATIVNFFLRRITRDEDEKRNHIVVTFFKTGFSPFKFLIGGAAYIGNVIISNQARDKYRSTGSNINMIIGVLLLAFSFWYVSKKQNTIEDQINDNFKTNFSSYFDRDSIQVVDNLNLNSELFFL